MTFGTLRFGATCMALAGLLHISFVIFAGPSDAVLAIGTFVAAAGLWRGWRWLAWLVLLVVIVAIGLDFARLGPGGIPDGLLWALIVVDMAAVACLFVALWRPRPITA